MIKPKICKPARAANSGPNKAKMIIKRGFISRGVINNEITHDILMRKREQERQIRLILGQ